MKLAMLARGVGTLALLAWAYGAQALPVTIEDRYQGADGHGYGDRIGSRDYEVERMEVTRHNSGAGPRLNVKVFTYFNQARDPYGTSFGDLFLSVDGWKPFGAAPFASDHHGNGETWEFVFDTSDNRLFGGDFEILLAEQVAPATVVPGAIVRNGQEVLRGAGGVEAGSASWVSLSQASSAPGLLGYLEYDILLRDLGLGGRYQLGLKWGMSCANDTIEGVVLGVSEPPMWPAILASLLVGSAVRARRRP